MHIGYARVSTQDQNPELQIDALNSAECEQIFTDKISGVTRERPQLELCLKTLRRGDTLIVWRLDRLGRSLKDLVEIIAELENNGIAFRSLNEAIDTSSAGGKLIFHIFGALSEFESNLIKERTLAGLAAAKARGRTGGRKPKMSAKDVEKANAMLADPNITKVEVAQHFRVSRVTLDASLKKYSKPENFEIGT